MSKQKKRWSDGIQWIHDGPWTYALGRTDEFATQEEFFEAIRASDDDDYVPMAREGEDEPTAKKVLLRINVAGPDEQETEGHRFTVNWVNRKRRGVWESWDVTVHVPDEEPE